VRNPATGRQCYGGMKPVEQLEEYQVFEPQPPPVMDVPKQLSRRKALGLPKKTQTEEPAR